MFQLLSRLWSGNQMNSSKHTEQQLTETLQNRFKEVYSICNWKKNTSNYSIRLCFQAQNISVVDISGGCGAMYEIVVETKEFSGLSRVKQHQLITDTLKTEIKDMHGLRIHTSIPDSWNAPQFDCKNYYKTSLN